MFPDRAIRIETKIINKLTLKQREKVDDHIYFLSHDYYIWFLYSNSQPYDTYKVKYIFQFNILKFRTLIDKLESFDKVFIVFVCASENKLCILPLSMLIKIIINNNFTTMQYNKFTIVESNDNFSLHCNDYSYNITRFINRFPVIEDPENSFVIEDESFSNLTQLIYKKFIDNECLLKDIKSIVENIKVQEIPEQIKGTQTTSIDAHPTLKEIEKRAIINTLSITNGKRWKHVKY